MTADHVAPELKQILGALLFGARQPVSVTEMRRVLLEVAESNTAEGKAFAKISEAELVAALDQLKADLLERHIGLRLVDVAGGFRFQTDAACGPWLRHLLDIGKPTRLTRPTLETLAIIAYRQPVTRAEIESVRGVTVDTIVRNLMELQLIRIVGRSPLPGRPLLLGTTQLFLEHFGLKDLKDLPGIEQLCRKEEALTRRPRPAAPPAGKNVTERDLESGKDSDVELAGSVDHEPLAGAGREKVMNAGIKEELPKDGMDDDDAADVDDMRGGESQRPVPAGNAPHPESSSVDNPCEQGKENHDSHNA